MRAETRELHRQLDHHHILKPLLSTDVTLAQYQRALLALHAVTAPAENSIGKYLENCSLPMDYAPHRREPDLLRDLEYFGLPPARPAWDGPPIDSTGALIGCLYVLEGSTKGGRLIFNRLNERLGVEARMGGRFFSGYGRPGEELWLEFWRFAETHCPTEEIERACGGANALFRSYIDLLGISESPAQ